MTTMVKNHKKSIGYGIALTTGVTITSRLLAVLVNLAVIKILSPSELGLFLGIQSMVFIGSGFCDLGLSHGYRQMVSRDYSLRDILLWPTLVIKSATLLLYFFGLVMYMAYGGSLTIGTLLIAIGALVSQWPEVLSIDLYITREFRKAGVLGILSGAGMLFGVLLALLSSEKLLALSIGYSFGMVGFSIVAFLFANPTALSFKFTRKTILQARVSVPFFSSMLITKFGLFFGLTYLLATQDNYAVGIVGFPMKIYQLCLLLSTATTSVTLPHFHMLAHHSSKENLGAALGKLLGPLWVIMGCVAGICFLFPDMVVTLVGSSKYAESANLLRIFSAAILLKSLSIPAGNLLESRNLQWLRVVVQAISSTIIVLSILFLFPRYGLVTVPYSILTADAVSFILLWGINAVGMAHHLPWRKHVLGSAAIGISIVIAWSVSLNNILTLALFLAAYIGLATLTRVWKPLELIKKIQTT